MKYLHLFGIAVCISTLIFSCKNKNKTTTSEQEIGAVNVDQRTDTSNKITKRDLSITPANSFNDLFLDSLAMEKYISSHELGDKIIGSRMRSFYNARNYQYAWFSSNGATESARLFWNQYDYAVNHLKDSTISNKTFSKKAENYLDEENMTVSTRDTSLLQTEFGFTEAFIRYINSTYERGYVKRKEQEKFIPIKKSDPLDMADSILNKKHKDSRYYEDVNEMYGGLKKQLSLYYTIAKSGGWPMVTLSKGTLKKGKTDPQIPILKNRLRISQDLIGNDSSQVFDDTLEAAVQHFQLRHGYKADGVITPTLVKDMNIPAEWRLMQVLINMDRMRWMPQKPNGNLIIVNIPEFMLHVYDGKQQLFEMVVVVGKESNNTVMFNGDLSQIIFSPYWNIPASIAKKEILPALARNPNYLENKNMEMTGNQIRQKPGPGNALGKVKFVFPNSFSIYFHDTPSKSLFNEDKRAFSHGCIRLSQPQKMAEWLLQEDPDWTSEKIVEAMNAGKEKAVTLKKRVPVFIMYYTAWVDSQGLLHFGDDVYGHDRDLITKIFSNQVLNETGNQPKGTE